ncbi:MAG: MauE/DoxX family redox-associated membrane protein [Chthoniobacterales bacterium]
MSPPPQSQSRQNRQPAPRFVAAFLGVLFIFSGVLKLQDPNQLFFSLMEAQIVSANAAYYLSRWLPGMEIALGGLGLLSSALSPQRYFFRLLRFVFGLAAAALLIAFTSYLLIAWQRGVLTNCACFGPWGAQWGIGMSLLRNAILFLCALFSTGSLRLKVIF